MAASGLIALLLFSAELTLPSLVGERHITRDRVVFERDAEATIAVPLEKENAWTIAFLLDGRPLELQPKITTSEDTKRFRFKLPNEAHADGAFIVRKNDKEVKRWRIAIASLADEAPAVFAAAELKKQKQFEKALDLLEPELKSKSLQARAWAEIERGNIEYSKGNKLLTDEWWLRGSKTARDAGLVGEANSRLIGIAWLRSQRGAFAACEQVLRDLEQYLLELSSPRLLLSLEYQRGLLYAARGEHLAAVRVFRPLLRSGKRIGDDRTQVDTTNMLAESLAQLGDFGGALKLYDDLSELGALLPIPDSFNRVNRGSLRLTAMQAEAIAADYDQVRADYLAAQPVIEKQGLPFRVANIHFHLAQLAYLEGDLATAEEELAKVDREQAKNSHIRWEAPLLTADLFLKKSDYDKAERSAREVIEGSTLEKQDNSSAEVVSAQILLADILRARGKRWEAIRAYRAALETAAKLATRLEIPRAKSSFMFRQLRAVESLAEMLLNEKRTAEAFATLLDAQSSGLEAFESAVRVDSFSEPWRAYQNARGELTEAREQSCNTLRSTDRKACASRIRELELASEEALRNFYAASGGPVAKKISSNELLAKLKSALAADEEMVAIFHLSSRWIAFHLSKTKLTYELADGQPRRWIAEIKDAGHVYFLLGDRTEDLNPHTFQGADHAPLAASISMSYLPSTSALFKNRDRPLEPAFFIGDPDQSLPHAIAEARELTTRFFPNAVVFSGDAATRPAVTINLPGRSVFHFIGHGRLLSGDPWTTELQLANGESLVIADLLSMRAEVGVAVLEGCLTGARSANGELGFPQVMISTGTHTVLATTEELKAAESSALMHRFYAAGGALQPGAAFRDAIKSSIDNGDVSWRKFRLWGLR